MAPLPTPFSALQILTRFRTTPKITPTPAQILRRISPRLRYQYQYQPQHLYLPLTHFPSSSFYSTTTSASSTHKPHAPKPRTNSTPTSNQITRPPQPEYEMTFTCTPCSVRSTHRVSKQGYHKGSVLITCPGCKNRHVISDHLGIFGDKTVTIEDLMRDKGQMVKKGTLSENGDLEFWDDGTTTPRAKPVAKETPAMIEGAGECGETGKGAE